MLTLYGLKTCDTCRKAIKALEASGQAVTFRDVRAEPLKPQMIREWLHLFGDDLVNTRSTTWRSLAEQERKLPKAQLLAKYPALMKRPVIEHGGILTLGWSAPVQKQYLGSQGARP